MINIFCLTFFHQNVPLLVLFKFDYNFMAAELYLSGKCFVDRLENFRSTVANKSELEVCLIFFPNRKTCLVYFSSEIFPWQSKNLEKLSSNRAQLFLRNKYTVFTMGGSVALRSVNNKNFRRATVLQLTTLKKKLLLRWAIWLMDLCLWCQGLPSYSQGSWTRGYTCKQELWTQTLRRIFIFYFAALFQ